MSDFSRLGSTHHGVARSWAQYRAGCELVPWGTMTGSKRPNPDLSEDQPAQVDRAKGSRLWDPDGNEYLDLRLGCGPITLGYCYEPVDRAAKAQLDRGVLSSLPVDLERRVAALLVDVIPHAEMVRYFKGGGEAMGGAIRHARRVTGRDRVVTCGYHGWLATMDESQPAALRALFTNLGYDNTDAFAAYLDAHGAETACVCVSGDYTLMRPGDPFLADVRELTRKHGVLLVVDEIVTGFRVRRGGLSEYCGVTPDLAAYAKGMANGFPLAALVGRREIMEQWAGISHTYGSEAVSLAASEATLTVYRNEDVIGHLWRLGSLLQDTVNEGAASRGLPFRLRGLPVCPQMDFAAAPQPATAPRASQTTDASRPRHQQSGSAADLQTRLFRGLYRRGIIPFTILYESYSHTEDEMRFAAEAMLEVLEEAYQ